MKHLLTVRCLCLILLVSAWVIVPAYSADVTVGLLAGSNTLGEVEEAAYEWAEDNFQTKTLLVDKSGNFKDGGTAMQRRLSLCYGCSTQRRIHCQMRFSPMQRRRQSLTT